MMIYLIIIIYLINLSSFGNSKEYAYNIIGLYCCDDRELIESSLLLAYEEILNLYPNIPFKLINRTEEDCDNNFQSGWLSEQHLVYDGVSVIIGPGCSSALDSVARLATYWNIPMCTGGGMNYYTTEHIFPTLIRLTISVTSIVDNLIKILDKFLWKNVIVICFCEDWFSMIKNGLIKQKNKRIISIDVPKPKSKRDKFIKDKLKEYKDVFRVLGELDNVRETLISAYYENMGNGEYVFISVDIFMNSSGYSQWYRDNDSRNMIARQMWESLLTISMRMSDADKFPIFRSKLINTVKDKFNKDINENQVDMIIASYYDCVLLYAQALNERLMLLSNTSIFDGKSFILSLHNSTFNGTLGTYYIDENGNREIDFHLNDMDPASMNMRTVGIYTGYDRRFKLDKLIHWRNDKIPKDLNECLNCNKINYWWISMICLCSLIVICLIYIAYRRYRLEKDLLSSWWKINWSDITFEEFRISNSTFQKSSSSNMTAGDTSICSVNLHPPEMPRFKLPTKSGALQNTRIGIYKGCKVAVKSLNLEKISIPRSVLLELKQVRDIVHENLIHIIGLCIDEPNIGLVTEYCARGSLQQLLLNDSFALDWCFRYSIISDIIEGMNFIHSSIIHYHGRLKSSNCVINPHFVVKLTDFGLKNLLTTTDENPGNLFWTAPEHLRTKNPLSEGSQKGDVYSFAIILQEVITRTEPFDTDHPYFKSNRLTPEEILNLIRMSLDPPFRPFIPHKIPQELADLINKCWKENPSSRPNFATIKTVIKKLSKSSGSNLIDNLLRRMEQYTDTLEGLVQEKTAALIEEKRRSDELLYELLPKFVVQQLQNGHQVIPEEFSCVSICFIDIVDFTLLAAISTPLEVVTLLNDVYTTFDSIISSYDVYKVETCGDAYMVVSGIPVRNGDAHATELAYMSLNLMQSITTFVVKHKPDHKLELRIGIHSGPCAAGVVGSRMPRYCLFGDTVNTASRMESHGLPMMIHISEETAIILNKSLKFELDERGMIDIKGKGCMKTYWLIKQKE